MSDFIKKALGLFVEFDDSEAAHSTHPVEEKPDVVASAPVKRQPVDGNPQMSPQDIDKFTKHFNDVFERANIPKPDYYHFSKMMDMLESQIPDEKTRLLSVFATLTIQGLTKEQVVDTARQYMALLDQDKAQFEKAAAEKVYTDIEDRKAKVAGLEHKIADNTEMIRKLTQEITETQITIGKINTEIVQLDTKIAANKRSYSVAFQAMYNKITSDIQKLNSFLK